MIRTGWTGRTSQLAAVVFSLLITGVRADGEAGLAVFVVIIVIFLKLMFLGYRIRKCLDSQNTVLPGNYVQLHLRDSNIDIIVPQTSLSQLVSNPHPAVKRARHRLAAQERQQTSAVVTPSLPAGRYRGSCSLIGSADREAVEYTLHFSSNGTVEGTMKTGNTGTKFDVFGVYDAEKQEFQWAESNVRSLEGTTYLDKLMEVSTPNYYGLERLTEASVRVIEMDTVSLVGDFINSSGATGDLRLIYSPNTDGFDSFTPQPEEVSVPMETPLLQKSMSF